MLKIKNKYCLDPSRSRKLIHDADGPIPLPTLICLYLFALDGLLEVCGAVRNMINSRQMSYQLS